MVMPILNMVNVINQCWQSLGCWTFAFKDYMALNLMADLNRPIFQQMADLIDPVVYMKYLAPIPKYMVFSTGDEFFLPDSARNFYNQLQGPFNLRMVPNTEHSLAPLDELVTNNIASFFLLMINGQPVPNMKETIVYSNTTASITVMPSAPPTEAKLWQTTTLSSVRRDFRLLICPSTNCFQPVIWTYSTLKANADGSYSASVPAPSSGWTGFLIELSYQTPYNQGSNWFQITSQVVVVPDMYPFPSCGLNCGLNSTLHHR
jgi:PhoPQ-activated pathogenicity-related protein